MTSKNFHEFSLFAVSMETNTFSAWHYIFELVTSISVPNFMLVSKSAQFPLNLELRRQTIRDLYPLKKQLQHALT